MSSEGSNREETDVGLNESETMRKGPILQAKASFKPPPPTCPPITPPPPYPQPPCMSFYMLLPSPLQRSIGSDSQGRVTAANNQRQLAENKKPFNFLPMHVNSNKSKETPASTTPSTSTLGPKEPKKQSPGKDLFAPVPTSSKDAFGPERGQPIETGQGEPCIDSSQVLKVCSCLKASFCLLCKL